MLADVRVPVVLRVGSAIPVALLLALAAGMYAGFVVDFVASVLTRRAVVEGCVYAASGTRRWWLGGAAVALHVPLALFGWSLWRTTLVPAGWVPSWLMARVDAAAARSVGGDVDDDDDEEASAGAAEAARVAVRGDEADAVRERRGVAPEAGTAGGAPADASNPHATRWCRKCNAPKPPRGVLACAVQ